MKLLVLPKSLNLHGPINSDDLDYSSVVIESRVERFAAVQDDP